MCHRGDWRWGWGRGWRVVPVFCLSRQCWGREIKMMQCAVYVYVLFTYGFFFYMYESKRHVNEGKHMSSITNKLENCLVFMKNKTRLLELEICCKSCC